MTIVKTVKLKVLGGDSDCKGKLSVIGLFCKQTNGSFPLHSLLPSKGQTVQQCVYSLAALTKGTFGRLFDWLLKVINRALGNDSQRDG